MYLPAVFLEFNQWIQGFILVFLRISAMFLAAPFFSAASVSVRIRVLLAALVSWIILPTINIPNGFELMSAEGLLSIAQQLLLGLSIGFMAQLVFATLILGGQLMAMSMGLGFAISLDPQNGVQTPVISQFYLILGTLIFLSLDIHLILIQFIAESFELMPVIGPVASSLTSSGFDSSMTIVSWASHLFSGALLFALPMLAVILIVNLALGIMTRAAPQLNIFAVGFPITLGVGFVFILLTLPSLLPMLNQWFELVFEAINQFIIL